jgi:hypothetical protein
MEARNQKKSGQLATMHAVEAKKEYAEKEKENGDP